MSFSHVLITRPEPEASRLAEALAAHGVAALSLPAFRFEPLEPALPEPRDWHAAARRLAVFVSPRAVHHGVPQLPGGFLDTAQIAALGPATAQALHAAGLGVDLQPEAPFTSESLLAAPGLTPGPGCAVLFAAPGGREALHRGLEALGWQVHRAMVYQRLAEPPAGQAVERLRDAAGVLSIWTSATAMARLLDVLPPDVREVVLAGCFLVISERLAELARQRGAAQVRLAPGPDNQSLGQAVLGLVK